MRTALVDSQLTRRTVLGAQIAGAATVLAAPAIAQGRQAIEVLLSGGADEHAATATRLADRIREVSDGQLNLNIGETRAGDAAFAAVASGEAGAYLGSEDNQIAQDPVYGLFGGMPVGLGPREFEAWVFYGGGQALWDQVSGQFGVKPILVGDLGPRAAGWFKSPVRAAGDLSGRRVNTSGLGAIGWQALGAEAVELAPGDIVSGADGSDSLGFVADTASGFADSFLNLYTPSLMKPHSAITLGVNAALWQGLSEADRTLLNACCTAEADYMVGASISGEMTEYETLRGSGLSVEELPQALFNAMAGTVSEAVGAHIRANSNSGFVYDQYMSFLNDVSGWTAISDSAFSIARAKALGI